MAASIQQNRGIIFSLTSRVIDFYSFLTGFFTGFGATHVFYPVALFTMAMIVPHLFGQAGITANILIWMVLIATFGGLLIVTAAVYKKTNGTIIHNKIFNHLRLLQLCLFSASFASSGAWLPVNASNQWSGHWPEITCLLLAGQISLTSLLVTTKKEYLIALSSITIFGIVPIMWLIGPPVAAGLAGIALALMLAVQRRRLPSWGNLSLTNSILDDLTVGLITLDEKGVIKMANRAASRLFSCKQGDMIGRNWTNVLSLPDNTIQGAFALLHERTTDSKLATRQIETTGIRHNGQLFPVEVSVNGIKSGHKVTYTAIIRDITARKAAEHTILDMAHHDTLTGLASRILFQQKLESALQKARQNGTIVAVLFLNLDKFKKINDSHGRKIGDQLLIEAANRMTSSIRDSDMAARLGGDEFAIILAGFGNPDDIRMPVHRIMDRLGAPVEIADYKYMIDTSIGISLFPQDDDTAEELIHKATIALYEAKETGRSAYCFYHPSMEAMARLQKTLETDLKHAIKEEQMELHYQPVIDCRNGQVIGAEALIRWFHPEHGMISPGEFIPLAETNGLINPLGEWVLKTACKQARTWQDAGLPPLRIAVNISAQQFHNERIVELVSQALYDSGLEARYLELEITERTVMSTAEVVLERMNRLHQLGIGLAIDDFGTGYSSLVYLKKFPLQRLKIDRTFVDGLPGNADDCAITSSVVSLGKSLRLQITGEGVETHEQLGYLKKLGCDEVQGFLFSPALPNDQFEEWVKARDITFKSANTGS